MPFNAKQFKVDVMQTLGSSKVEINANKELESYSVAVDIGSGQQARVGFTVREQPALCGKRACELKQVDKNPDGVGEDPQPMQLPPEKAKAALDSRSYAREHNIPNLVQEMLQHILREKPESPFMVMSDYFRKKGEEMGEKPEGATWVNTATVGYNTVGETFVDHTVETQAFITAQATKIPEPYYGGSVYAPAQKAVPQAPVGGGAVYYTPAQRAPETTTVPEKTLTQPAAQTQYQRQSTIPGEYYVPNLPDEDPHDGIGMFQSAYGSDLPAPSDFPEDPAAHIMMKAPPAADGPPPPPPARTAAAPAYGLPPPGQKAAPYEPAPPVPGTKSVPPSYAAAPQAAPYEPRAFVPAPPAQAMKSVPPASRPVPQAPPPQGHYQSATAAKFGSDGPVVTVSGVGVDDGVDPFYAGDMGVYAEAVHVRPPKEEVEPAGPTWEPSKTAKLSGDPERLQLEAEHMTLQAERSSLLRELNLLSSMHIQQATVP